MQTYVHRQVSPWLVVALALPGVALLVYGLGMAEAAGGLVMFVLLTGLAIAFSSLTTRVDAFEVSWAYTLGAPGGAIPFNAIAGVELTRTNFWEGWGIHWTIWHGWLWNVGGYGAVMIRKKDGRTLTLGTDDPQGLCDAIRSRLRA
jgi:hypothetical protein